ncbi:hypothetical protein [Paraflavitalea speifideaquila]|uniref:hypothetical protein n=1 Tax=Paraflavitalea speifideaquila TaxID=3076558 RepID=UPI0028E1CD15|nr:hypothetical protein [Paraflavitalea speifideiaquila]
MKEGFKQANKTNLQVFVFKGHNHDLNYQEWIRKKTIPEGIEQIFEVAATLK